MISQAKFYSSLKFLSRHYTVGKCHPAIKPFPLSKKDINRIPVKNKILTGSYILQTNRVKFNQNEINPECQLCWSAEETLQHFLLDCSFLENTRKPIISDLKTILNKLLEVCPLVKRHSFLQLVVDCSAILEQCPRKKIKIIMDYVAQINYQSRRLSYAIHAARYSKLELSTKYCKAKNKKKTQ